MSSSQILARFHTEVASRNAIAALKKAGVCSLTSFGFDMMGALSRSGQHGVGTAQGWDSMGLGMTLQGSWNHPDRETDPRARGTVVAGQPSTERRRACRTGAAA